MKDTQLKKLFDGKDMTKEETFSEVTDAINNEFNSILKKKEDSFNEKFDVLKKDYDTLKANSEAATKQLKDLDTKLAEANKTIDLSDKRAYVYKNIGALEDEDMKDLLTLTSSRMDKNSKFEDVVVDVARRRGFVKSAEPKSANPIPPAPKADNLTNTTQPKKGLGVSAEEFKDWYFKKK